MSDIIETFKFSRNSIDFTVNVVCAQCYDGFGDQWKMTDTHEGGVTIKNADAGRNSYKYAIPQQTTLAELASYYAAQGRENPSREAYESLQRQLSRDINASDYYFTVDATAGSHTLLDGAVIGCGFDYSYDDEGSLLDAAREVWKEHDGEAEALEEATKAAHDLLEGVDVLKSIVENAQ